MTKETNAVLFLAVTCHYLIDVLSSKSHAVPLLFQANHSQPSRHCAHATG